MEAATRTRSERTAKHAKYAWPDDGTCGIGSAGRPTGIVEGDKNDWSVAAELITAKWVTSDLVAPPG